MSMAVAMRGITKAFGPVSALANVDLNVQAGTLHAVVGENGAGKTTLMKALYGALIPDSGSISVHGKAVILHRQSDAIRAGIGMVTQHYSIIPELTCLQNLILGAEPGPFLSRGALLQRAEKLAEQVGYAIDWEARAETLGPAGCQKLEILRLLWREAKIMVLDEPTAMLSVQESEALYASLQTFVAAGQTVIVVTHRIADVLQYASAVTVLRGGQMIHEGPTNALYATQLASLIVGREVDVSEPEVIPNRPNVALELEGLTVRGKYGEKLKNISLKLNQGEIVAIAGVDGSGQRELFQALLGTMRPSSGSVRWNGKDMVTLSIRDRLAEGIRLVPEDRHEEGVVEAWSMIENARIGLQRTEVDREYRSAPAQVTARICERFNTKFGSVSDPLGSLSGGNQQRFVAARAMEGNPQLVLAFQPCRGLDILATQRIYQGLHAAARDGATVLVVVFDLDELLDYFANVVVMFDGRMSPKLSEDERSRERIGQLMVGAS